MDLVPLIDWLGENGAAAFGGALLGLAFGIFAQRSAYCTRSAVLDLTRGRDLSALAIWAAGFATAVLGVQLLLTQDMLAVGETRFFSTPQSLSGAVVGGLVFGAGMVLARGCVSRLLVLGASGNLRAAFSIVVIALVGLATYGGVLVPLRDQVSSLANTSAIGGNDLLAHAGLAQSAGLWIGGILAIAALAIAVKARASAWKVIGGIGVGATVVAGWWFTWQLSQQVFEPIQAESLSFIRPLAVTAGLAGGGEAYGLDVGLALGAVAGAFLAAIVFRDFRIATFSEPGTPSVLRYLLGAVLMGFGGILAVGCTIGAGLTGGSVLAVTSLLGLASMIAGAALTDILLDRRAAGEPTGSLVAAE